MKSYLGAWMLLLKSVYDFVHGKELISRKPQYEACFGHLLQCLAPE